LDKPKRRPEPADGAVDGNLEERIGEVRDFFRLTAQEWAAKNLLAVEGLGDLGGAFRQTRKQRQDEVRRLVVEIVSSAVADSLEKLDHLLRDAPMEILVPACEELAKLRHGAAVPLLVREFRGAAPEAKQAMLRLVAEVGDAGAYQLVADALTDEHEGVRWEAERAREALVARDGALRIALALASGQRPDGVQGEPQDDEMVKRLALRLSNDLPLGEGLAALEALRSGSEESGDSRPPCPWAQAVFSELLALVQPEGGREAASSATSPKLSTQKPLLLLAAVDADLPDWALAQTCQAVIVRASSADRSTVLRKAPPAAAARLLRQALRSKSHQSVDRGLVHLAHDRPDLVETLAQELEDLAFGVDIEHAVRAATLLLKARPAHERAPQLARRLAVLIALGAGERGSWADSRVIAAACAALLGCEPGRMELARTWLFSSDESAGSSLVQPSLAALQGTGETERAAFVRDLCRILAGTPVIPPEAKKWAVGEIPTLHETDQAVPAATWLPRGLARLCLGLCCGGPAEVGSNTSEEPGSDVAILAHILREHAGLRQSLGPSLVEELIGARTQQLDTLLATLAGAPEAVLDLLGVALHQGITLISSLMDHLGAVYASDPGTVRRRLGSGESEAALRVFLEASAELERNELLETASRYLAEDRAERQYLNESINDLLDCLEEMVTADHGVVGEGKAGSTAPAEDVGILRVYVGELADALFTVLNDPPSSLPEPPRPTGHPLEDYHQVRLTHLAASKVKEQRSAALRSNLAAQAALPVEKLLLTLRGHPARDSYATLLAGWFRSLGMSFLEPTIGAVTHFRSGKHLAVGNVAPGEQVEVLTWGFIGLDGSILRPALTARLESE